MRHGSLFSGIGGFDLAASWMGWENVFQVEWDKYCQKVLAKNFPDVLRFGDIVEFNKMLKDGTIITDTGLQRQEISEKQTAGIDQCSEKAIKNTISKSSGFKSREISDKKWRANENKGKSLRQKNREISTSRFNPTDKSNGINLGRIDIITGGFPCQPFSHAGKRKGTDDSRYLWPEMLTTIRILKPSFVVGENVAGLVSMENGKTLDNILSDLANEGYQTEQFIIPACGVGAWHRRDRIWIVAYCQCKRLEKWEKRKLLEQCKTIKRSDIQSIPISNNTKTTRQREYSRKILQGTEPAGFNITNNKEWWTVEPSVGRVANGVSNRVDRLKGLGNSIVPQVVYEIFKAIEQIN